MQQLQDIRMGSNTMQLSHIWVNEVSRVLFTLEIQYWKKNRLHGECVNVNLKMLRIYQDRSLTNPEVFHSLPNVFDKIIDAILKIGACVNTTIPLSISISEKLHPGLNTKEKMNITILRYGWASKIVEIGILSWFVMAAFSRGNSYSSNGRLFPPHFPNIKHHRSSLMIWAYVYSISSGSSLKAHDGSRSRGSSLHSCPRCLLQTRLTYFYPS